MAARRDRAPLQDTCGSVSGERQMRIGSYSYQGRATYGAFTPQGVVDLGARLLDLMPQALA